MQLSRQKIVLQAIKELAPEYKHMEADRYIEQHLPSLFVNSFASVGLIQKKGPLFDNITQAEESKISSIVNEIIQNDAIKEGKFKTSFRVLAKILDENETLESITKHIEDNVFNNKNIIFGSDLEGPFRHIIERLQINEEIVKLKQTILKLTQKANHLDSQLQQTKKDNTNHKKQASTLSTQLKTEIETQKKTITELEKKLKGSDKAINQHLKELNTLQNENDEKKNSIKKLETQAHDLQKQLSLQKSKLNEYEKLTAQLNKQLSERDLEIKKFTDKLTKQDKEKSTVDNKLSKLEIELESARSSLTSIEAEKNKLNQQVNDLESTATTIQQEINSSKTEKNQLTEKLKEMETNHKNESLKQTQKIEALNVSLEKARVENEKLSFLRKEKLDIERRLTKLEFELKTTKVILTNVSQDKTNLNTKICELESSINNSQQTINLLKNEKNSLIDKLKISETTLKNKTNEYAKMIGDLNYSLKKANSEIDRLNIEIKYLKSQTIALNTALPKLPPLPHFSDLSMFNNKQLESKAVPGTLRCSYGNK